MKQSIIKKLAEQVYTCQKSIPHRNESEGFSMSKGANIISHERQRQIDEEGWDLEHDDTIHATGELLCAAISYSIDAILTHYPPPEKSFRNRSNRIAEEMWRWDAKWWKPTPEDYVRQLAKAGALIAAEIDRVIND